MHRIPSQRLGLQDFGHDHEYRYGACVSGIGDVEFQASERLSPREARKLVFVHPWICGLRDPLDGLSWGGTTDDDEDEDRDGYGPEGEEDADLETETGSAPSSPLHVAPAATINDYTRALRLIVRLQQPFHALLLQQQPNGEFKRVATEHEIIVPGIGRQINSARDIHADVTEIL